MSVMGLTLLPLARLSRRLLPNYSAAPSLRLLTTSDSLIMCKPVQMYCHLSWSRVPLETVHHITYLRDYPEWAHNLNELHTSQITATTAHIKFSQFAMSSPVVAWWWIPPMFSTAADHLTTTVVKRDYQRQWSNFICIKFFYSWIPYSSYLPFKRKQLIVSYVLYN
jgi:hypothetical protein